MTGAELAILNTALLSGQSIDEDVFYQLLNMKKDLLEMRRDWVILRDFSSSITFSSSDTYLSTKTLPDRFLRVYSPFDANEQEQTGVYLVTSAGSRQPLTQIAFARRYEFKDSDGYFYIDLKNNKIGRTGTVAGTLHLFYLQGTEDIAAATEWTFPTFAHPLLAYEVAIEQKGGIDWDRINASQIPFNRDTVAKIESGLAMWDARHQQAELGV